MKRRGGRPGAASCCQSTVNASLPSQLPTSPSAIFDGLLFIREKVLLEEEKRLTPEKPPDTCFIASLEIFEEILGRNNSVCLDKSKPERLTRPQAGMIIPVKTATTNGSAEGTKDHLSPFQGFRSLV